MQEANQRRQENRSQPLVCRRDAAAPDEVEAHQPVGRHEHHRIARQAQSPLLSARTCESLDCVHQQACLQVAH